MILAGGKGTRLRPLTDTVAKPMLRFYGKPFLWYVIEELKRNKITNIVLLVGYFHEQFKQYFGDGRKFGVTITYSYMPVETDTGSRIKHALLLCDKRFLLLYGDNLWPLPLAELTRFYDTHRVSASVVVYRNRDKSTRNNVFVNDSSFLERYDRKRISTGLNGVDIGFFIVEKSIFARCPRTNFSFEDVIIPRLVREKQLAAFMTDQKYYGLSTPDRIPRIKKYLTAKKVVFLDRDGVINKRPAKAQYIERWSDFEFLPKAKEALRLLKEHGYTVFIITNQPGIARGEVTKRNLDIIHRNLNREIEKAGGTIAGIYLCPHGWDEGCFCRKPNPGLFFQASYDHAINLTDSICIGDDQRDIMAGKRAACKKTIFIGDSSMTSFSPSEQPDTMYASLYDAVLHI